MTHDELHKAKLARRREAYKHDPSKAPRLMRAVKNYGHHAAAYFAVRAIAPPVAESKMIKYLYKDALRHLWLEIRYWKEGKNGK
jgi:hypothetical protein